MPKSKDSIQRHRHLHVMLSDDEHRKLSVVVKHSGGEVSDYVRRLLMADVERLIDAARLRPALPTRSAFAPAVQS